MGPEQRARELLVFADGVEDAGHPELARRSRVVARDVLELVSMLAAERSARVAIQAARDRLQELLMRRATTAQQIADAAAAPGLDDEPSVDEPDPPAERDADFDPAEPGPPESEPVPEALQEFLDYTAGLASPADYDPAVAPIPY